MAVAALNLKIQQDDRSKKVKNSLILQSKIIKEIYSAFSSLVNQNQKE